MKRTPDKKGGNCNIYFTEDLKARKYLRNTSSEEKMEKIINYLYQILEFVI